MLLNLRDSVKNSRYAKYVIVGLIAIPFGLVGINYYIGGHTLPPVASVEGTSISAAEFDGELRAVQAQMRRMFQGNVPPALLNSPNIINNALETAVLRELSAQHSAALSLAVSDEQLGAELLSSPTFQLDGQFSPEAYQRELASRGFTPAGYEQTLREELASNQLTNLLRGGDFVLTSERERSAALAGQTRDVSFVTLSAELDREAITDAALQQYFEEQGDRYETQARAKVEYIKLDRASIAAAIDVDDAAAQSYFERNKASFGATEERQIAHILFESDRERAETVLQSLRDGADFFETAQRESEDVGSAEQGGDLGRFDRGVMVEAFDDVAFALEKGELSDVVETEFGYHLIKVLDIYDSGVAKFDEVKDEVLDRIRTDQASVEFGDLVETMATVAYEEDSSLSPAAQEIDRPVLTSEWVTAERGAGDIDAGNVLAAVFSETVLGERRNSEVLQSNDDTAIVLRIAEYEAPRPQTLDEVREQVLDDLARDNASQALSARVESVLEMLQSGVQGTSEGLLNWARDNDMTLDTVETVGRSGKDAVDAQFAQAVFQLPKDQTYGSHQLRSGDWVVFGVENIQPGPIDTEVTINSTLAELQAMRAGLRANSDVVINEAAISQILNFESP